MAARMHRQTLSQRFWVSTKRAVSWGLRLLLTILPIIRAKTEKLPLIWPPLGSIETYAAGVAAVLIATFAVLPQTLRTKAKAKIGLWTSLALASVCLCFYAYFLASYVKADDTPKDGTVYRVIGSQRTEEAIRKLPNTSDEEILREAGLTDGDIERMWTPESVNRARLELFVSYVGALSSVNFLLGAFSRLSIEVETA